jgi:hypothetical protein
MRPDHSTTPYSASRPAMPLAAPILDDGNLPNQPRPLARMTFYFAWLFGLEPFLLGGIGEQSQPEPEPDREM